jgi:CDP-paratose 2-epimerase
MSLAIISGSSGLVGSAAAYHLHGLGLDIWGIDNDLRSYFFGPEGSTLWMRNRMANDLPNYHHHDVDIREGDKIDSLFEQAGRSISLVIHSAAQPSHDWAARQPHVDFEVNATGTLNLLEATRKHSPDASFIFTSTNKVYGDAPNRLTLVEQETRFDLPVDHEWYPGVPEHMSIDQSTHSLFGVSKASADLLVQEYGRYFGLATACFRGGCLTGPGHSGAQLHGFLAYLMKCTVTRTPYTVYGYRGKQVRDNIHAADLSRAFEAFMRNPRAGAVYNMGGGRHANCSMLEAIDLCERIAGETLDWTYTGENRIGDHKWWISDVTRFQTDYPEWSINYSIEEILQDIYASNSERWRLER